MRTVNVLSVDWDFFINVSLNERIALFPDVTSENIDTRVFNFVWATRYAESMIANKSIKKIGVYKGYAKLKTFLSNLPSTIPVLITDSHEHAYQFFKEENHLLNVVNIDLHHDMYRTGADVDCGNWLLKLVEENRVNSITWVNHEDSDIGDVQNYKNLQITTNINSVLNRSYSRVFICRSSIWSPPHLDKKFIELCMSMKAARKSIDIAEMEKFDRYKQIEETIPFLVKQLEFMNNSEVFKNL